MVGTFSLPPPRSLPARAMDVGMETSDDDSWHRIPCPSFSDDDAEPDSGCCFLPTKAETPGFDINNKDSLIRFLARHQRLSEEARSEELRSMGFRSLRRVFVRCPIEFQDDYELVCAFVSIDPDVLDSASRRLQNDRGLIMLVVGWIKATGRSACLYCKPEPLDNEEFVKGVLAVAALGAGETSPDVVRNCYSLVCKRLSRNREFARSMTRLYPEIFGLTAGLLKDDTELLDSILSEDPKRWREMPRDLLGDRDFLKSIPGWRDGYPLFSDELRRDLSLAREVAEVYPTYPLLHGVGEVRSDPVLALGALKVSAKLFNGLPPSLLSDAEFVDSALFEIPELCPKVIRLWRGREERKKMTRVLMTAVYRHANDPGDRQTAQEVLEKAGLPVHSGVKAAE